VCHYITKTHLGGQDTLQYGIDTNWYTDTGATDHITSNLEKLSIHDKYNGGDKIRTASGTGMNINHVGHATIKTPSRNLHLRNILHVPQAKKNLVSVHRLAADNNAFLEFHPNFFLVKDQETKKTLLEGRCKGGLYPLPESNKEALSAIRPSLSRWHSRLGHPSFPIVHKIISENKLACAREANVGSVCDACQQAKSHQLPYPKSSSISKFPLDLIFFDVWGPAPGSVGRNKYYVSFIDDHSKFVWIYLLRYKSEVFAKFTEFQQLVERHFNRKFVSIQTDWGGEYERLNSFFKNIGISHLVSCPHAHQQNGAAERKHRHIVEVGLSLLAHASMPLKFWDEAFIAATYLINLTPSKIIQYSTPLATLFNEQPDYSSLRVFGCACWPNLRPYNSRKLAFRSKRCAFLGYSNMHKGYKCLDISSGRVYISRDVIFDEAIFPLSELHEDAGARLRKEVEVLPDLFYPSRGPIVHDLSMINGSNVPANSVHQPANQNSEQNPVFGGILHTASQEPTSASPGADPPAGLDSPTAQASSGSELQHPGAASPTAAAHAPGSPSLSTPRAPAAGSDAAPTGSGVASASGATAPSTAPSAPTAPPVPSRPRT
jgi:histone deacetylase 1/2